MMPFTVDDFQDLMRLLAEHPEWRAELRRDVLSEELLALPELVRGLAAAQSRTEASLAALVARMDDLAASLAALVARMDDLAASLAALATRVDELGMRIGQLTEAQTRTEQAVAGLIVDVAALKGHDLERRYRERPFDFFGRLVRRAHAFTQEELDRWLEGPVAAGSLTEDEADEILLADAVIRGRRRADQVEVHLVVEVAAVLDSHDVGRAVRRAELLGRAGVVALPIMAGPAASMEAQRAAHDSGVTWIADGAFQLLSPPA